MPIVCADVPPGGWEPVAIAKMRPGMYLYTVVEADYISGRYATTDTLSWVKQSEPDTIRPHFASVAAAERYHRWCYGRDSTQPVYKN